MLSPASPALPDTGHQPLELGWGFAATLALVVPALLAYNAPPSATFLNQAAALIGWGGFLAVLCFARPLPNALREPGLGALLAALAVLLVASLAAPLWAQQPWSLALSSAGLVAPAALAACVAAAVQRGGYGVPAFRALCTGLLITGLLSSLVGILQVFFPSVPDADWVARSGLPGIAIGNLRQPNHLSSLMLWAFVAVAWLAEARELRRPVAYPIALLFLFVVVLTGSRTGLLGAFVLAGWGLLDRRLSRPTRALLLLAPLAYGACWLGVDLWAQRSHHVFGAAARFTTSGDISSSRFAIWANTLSLIASHPWFGVGWGEFNFAWTLTPFPGRPVAFFDHTHDLPLQLAVELGLPLAALVLALLLWALWCALRNAMRAGVDPDAAQAPMQRAAFMMVLMISVHSLLEYPLWYAYFLLPASFVFGLCLARPALPATATAAATAGAATAKAKTGAATSSTMTAAEAAMAPQRPARVLQVGALVLMLGGIASLVDYRSVVVIFAPPDDAGPLTQRIADGQHSVFFSHHADYAAATTAEHPSQALPAFQAASHYLLDTRLMLAWAKALAEAGDVDRARYLAQRLQEFHNEQAESFFAPCKDAALPEAQKPFQCTPPQRAWRYEDFR